MTAFIRTALFSAGCAIALLACGDDDGVSAPDAGRDGGRIDLGSPSLDAASDDTGIADVGVADMAGALDVTVPDAGCVVDCAAPPLGCHWTGPTTCDPPSCGTIECEDAGVEPDGGTGPDGGSGPDAGADVVVCSGSAPTVFPELQESCTDTGECALALHQVDCCGSFAALGIRMDELPRFDTAERACESMLPRCRCAARPTSAEDGRSELDGLIDVECRAGACTSFVR